MPRERPPSFQWYPRDFAAAMHQIGANDPIELAYRRALDATWDEGAYGVGTLDEWLAWGRVPEDLKPSFSRAVAQLCQVQADGSYAQIRMARDRMEQDFRHRSNAEKGRKGGLKSRRTKRVKPSEAQLKHSQPHSSASASANGESQSQRHVESTVGGDSAGRLSSARSQR